MSRPTILCPGCGRELFHLNRPQCVWCGARLSQEQFEEVAAPPTAPSAFSPPMPPIMMSPPTMGFSWFGGSRGLFEGNPFPLIKRSVSPWERKLRIAGAALFVCVTLAKLAEILWSVWRLHQVMPPMH
jgi:hypothetical protein